MSKRSVKVGIGHVSISKGWNLSTITVETADRKATIEIREPWELNFLRRQLDEIEQYWKSCLEELSR